MEEKSGEEISGEEITSMEIATPAGRFSAGVNILPANCKCTMKPEILIDKENRFRVITYDQQIKLGEEVFSPVLYQSCMRPGEITVYPLEIKSSGEKCVVIIDHYHTEGWNYITEDNDIKLQISSWKPSPVTKRRNCRPCTNCGRC